jgi:hypothetical protein
VDSRVVHLREVEGEAAPTVVALLANHFPERWNRHEANEGVWPLRFAFTRQPGGFDAAFTDAFGRALAQPPAAYPTWLTAADPEKAFLHLDGDPVHLQAFQPGGDESVVVRLRNPRPDASATVRVSLPGRTLDGAERVSFLGTQPEALPLDAGAAALSLAPNEVVTLRLRIAPSSLTP